MRRAEAVLFDNDLTLCDTLDSIRGGYKHALSLVGIDFTEEELKRSTGGTLREIYQRLAPEHDLELLLAAHRQFQMDNPQLIRAFKHTRWTVSTLHEAGIKIGVVTNRYGETLYRMLEDAGVIEHIDAIVTNHDVKNPKPHPEHAWVALNILEAKPENSYLVGDDEIDIACGKAAGLTTVGAMWSFPYGKEWGVPPDYLAYDIGDVVLPAVMGEEYFQSWK